MSENKYPTRIDLSDGKYTLIFDFSTGQSECLRYGQPWRQLAGDKLLLACFDEIVEARRQRDELRAQLAALSMERDIRQMAERRNSELLKQRDELLAAIRHLLNAPTDPDAIDQAFTAIASVNGRQYHTAEVNTLSEANLILQTLQSIKESRP